MADRSAVPVLAALSRAELLALVPLVASVPVSALAIARARWEAALERSITLSEAADAAIGVYTEARAQYDTAQARGQSTKAASRAVDAAYAEYRRAYAASDAAHARVKRTYAAYNEALAERGDR